MEKSFEERINEQEKQKEKIKKFQKGIEKWQNWTLEEKHKFTDSTPGNLAVLENSDAKFIIDELAKAGIFGKAELKKKVKQSKISLGIEEELKPEELNIKIIEEELNPLCPALDFTDDLACVTVRLPIKTLRKKGNKQEEVIEPGYYTITSQKEGFFLTSKELRERGYYPISNPCILDRRWNYKDSIKPYLGNKIDSPNPVKLFKEIRDLFDKYMDYREERLYDFLTYWCIGTYLYPLFPAYPYIFLNGKSETGKSKTLSICEGLCFNAVNTGNISDASIYHIVEGARATILFDELENIADPNQRQNLLDLLLAGFRKGAKVIRLEKTIHEQFIPKKYEVHAPKIIANIKGLPVEALKNRCITFVTSPTKSDKAKIEPDLNNPVWQKIRNELYIFMLENWIEIKAHSKLLKTGLKGYDALRWNPIFTLAKFFTRWLGSEKSFMEMQSLAHDKIEKREEEKKVSYGTTLLESVIDLVSEGEKGIDKREREGKVFYSSKDIRKKYIDNLGITGEPPKWLTPQKVGKMLSSFDIGNPGKHYIGAERIRGIWINLNDLKDVAARFGIEQKIEVKMKQLNLGKGLK